jgi:hypothetical protein
MHGSIGNLVELLNKCINGGKYRGISRAYGIPYRRFTYRGIPFIPVYRATAGLCPIKISQPSDVHFGVVDCFDKLFKCSPSGKNSVGQGRLHS